MKINEKIHSYARKNTSQIIILLQQCRRRARWGQEIPLCLARSSEYTLSQLPSCASSQAVANEVSVSYSSQYATR